MPIISTFPSGSGGGGTGGVTLAPVTNIQTLCASGKVYVKWTDPDDLIVAGAPLASWSGTLLVRKANSAPISRRDGTVVLDSKTRNAYTDNYFCDSGLTNGTTYYYKLYPYTSGNAYTDTEEEGFSITPNPVQLGNVSGISVVNAGNGKLDMKWTDPDATIVSDGVTLATWANTTVVVKEGGYATDPDDPAAAWRQVVTTRNAYTATPLQATGLTNGTTYYVSFFPVSTDGAANSDAANRATGTPGRFAITVAPKQSSVPDYNGTAQTPDWDEGYDPEKMTIQVTPQLNAGDYEATATPTDNYCWDESLVVSGMADNLSPKPIPWKIAKRALTITAAVADKVYNGGNITVPDSVTAKDGETPISDVTFQYAWYAGESETPMAGTPKDVGAYRLVASIADSDLRYSGSSAEVRFSITAKPVTIVGLSASGKVYDGNTNATITGTATIAGVESGDTVTVSDGTAAFDDKDVGDNKTVTFSGYTLSGESAGNYSLSAQPASVTANITKRDVTVSGITASNKEYDGGTSATLVTSDATFDGIVSGDTLTVSGTGTFEDASVGDGKEVTISGLTLSGASAANYKLAESGHQGSTTANITKANCTMTGVPSSVTLNMTTLTSDFTIGGDFDGSYNVTSNNTSIATVSLVSGKTYRISHVDQTTGSATITVTPTGGTNYNAPAAQTISVAAQFVDTVLNNNTWDVISDIASKGKGDDYWDVGDCKQILVKGTVGTLSVNQNLCVYIIGFNHYGSTGIDFGTFKTALTGGTDVCLCDDKYNTNAGNTGDKKFNLNHWGSTSSPYNTNYGGWKGCDARYDILGSTKQAPSGYGSTPTTSRVGYDAATNTATAPVSNTLMAALPSDLRAVMKPMTIYTDNKGNSSNVDANVTTSVDYLPLLAEFEIFGTRIYANEFEKNHQAQYAYYSAGNSKVKYQHSNTGSTALWWERSPSYYNASHFCSVYTGGNANSSSSRNSYGLAPAFRV